LIHNRLSAESRRGATVALIGLLAIVLGWDLWAVIQDQRPSGSDTFTPFSIHLYQLLAGEEEGWRRALDPKGPFATLLGTTLLLLVGKVPLATRLLSVLCHGALLLQTYDLGRQLGRSRRAGLWAALICGTHPLIFGWCRLDYHEALLCVMVCGSLQLMLRADLSRLRPALLLGLVLGLGTLTKISFTAYIAAPGIWIVARRCLRPPRTAVLLRLGAVLGVMAAVTSPWLFVVGPELPAYLKMATQQTGSLEKALDYLALPGSWQLLLAAGVFAVVLWRSGPIDRWELALVAAQVLVSTLLLFMVFDPGSRYLVPVFPAAAVLTGAGLGWIQQRGPGRAGPLAWGLAAALLGLHAGLSLAGVEEPDHRRREEGAGLVAPDPRPYLAFPRALAALRPHGHRVLLVHDSARALVATEGLDQIWRFRGMKVELATLAWARQELRHRRPVPVILVRRPAGDQLSSSQPLHASRAWPAEPPGVSVYAREPEKTTWLARQHQRRRLLVTTDPDGTRYVAYRVGP
jgi:hypothetical protein